MCVTGGWDFFRYGVVNPAFGAHFAPSSRSALICRIGGLVWFYPAGRTLVNLAVVGGKRYFTRRILAGGWGFALGFILGSSGARKKCMTY